jgi:hypothetical protein
MTNNMDEIITIPVVTRLQNNGDGGYTTYVYNNTDELIADHPKRRNYRHSPPDQDRSLTQKEIHEILNEYDPYENGVITKEYTFQEVRDNAASFLQ